MSQPLAPVSGPPLVLPVQPIRPVAPRQGGNEAVGGAGQAPPQASAAQGLGSLLDIKV